MWPLSPKRLPSSSWCHWPRQRPMMLTLATVIGSQIAAVGSQIETLARLLPLYAGFVVAAVLIGAAASKVTNLDTASTRAVMFSVATRNSLVVLPLALALPEALAIAPLAVVTQTLVELIAMVILVRVVPAIAPTKETPDPQMTV